MPASNSFHHGDLKRALFEAALELLDSQGEGGVTIRAVARATGVSHSAPVNHYSDRRALLTAIAEHQFEIILANVESALLAAPDDPAERVALIASTMMEYGFHYPERYQLLWRGDLIDHSAPGLLAAMDSVYDQLCEAIQKAMLSASQDANTVAVALWSMIHGYVDMRRSGMFSPLDDSVSGLPRGEAIIELFRAVLR